MAPVERWVRLVSPAAILVVVICALAAVMAVLHAYYPGHFSLALKLPSAGILLSCLPSHSVGPVIRHRAHLAVPFWQTNRELRCCLPKTTLR